GIAQREARHQVVQRPAIRVQTLADGARQGRGGIGRSIAVNAFDIRQRRSITSVRRAMKQIIGGDRRNKEFAFPGPESAALVTIYARSLRASGAHFTLLANSLQRRAGTYNPVQIDRLTDTCGGCYGGTVSQHKRQRTGG